MALIGPCGTIMRQGQKRPLTSSQIRAARALVKWSAEDLARQSSVSLRTIRRAELAEPETSMTAPNDTAIRRAFEMAGIEFIDENGGGAGVRLRKRHQKKG
jgi:transcriptional regulator with XRE-family HTH domain